MENTGRQDSIGFTRYQHLIQVFQRASPTAGDNRHIYSFGYGPGKLDVISRLMTVSIYAGE